MTMKNGNKSTRLRAGTADAIRWPVLALAAVLAPAVAITLHAQQAADPARRFVPFQEFLASVTSADPAAHFGRSSARVTNMEAFEEMRRHVLRMYDGVVVNHSFVMNNHHFDCVPITQQPSVRLLGIDRIEAPLEPALSEPSHANAPGDLFTISQLDSTVALDSFGNSLQCEEETIPMRRITLEDLTRFPTLRAFFEKGPNGAGRAPQPSETTPPSPTGHLHVTGVGAFDNLGGQSYLNLWSPSVGPDSTFSLSQQWWYGGTGSSLQTVEGGWQVYPDYYGTENAALFIYWTADNYHETGCYNLDCPGFVQVDNRWKLGGGFPKYSTAGGPQYGFTMQWVMRNGNWWLKLNNDLVGYYPGSIYRGGQLSTNAQHYRFGGETAVPNWACYPFFCPAPTWAPMGSGAWAEAGYGHAAFQGSMRVLDTSKKWWDASIIIVSEAPNCYSGFGDVLYGTHLFFGGPGGKNCGPW